MCAVVFKTALASEVEGAVENNAVTADFIGPRIKAAARTIGGGTADGAVVFADILVKGVLRAYGVVGKFGTETDCPFLPFRHYI